MVKIGSLRAEIFLIFLMLPGQMLFGQMSTWQLESVLDLPRNLPLKFHQNRVSNSWYIADLKVPCGEWWVVCKPILVFSLGSKLNKKIFFLLFDWISSKARDKSVIYASCDYVLHPSLNEINVIKLFSFYPLDGILGPRG